MIITSVKLSPGDMLALKSDQDFVHKFLQDHFGNIVEKLLTSLTGQEYLHVELYLGEGWSITATPNGIKLQKYDIDTIARYFDIFRPKIKIHKEKLIDEVKKHHNKPYDFTSLFLNIVEEISEIFSIKFETPYSSEYQLICSELVATIYEDLGIVFRERPEVMQPQDLVNSGYFIKIA